MILDEAVRATAFQPAEEWVEIDLGLTLDEYNEWLHRPGVVDTIGEDNLYVLSMGLHLGYKAAKEQERDEQ